MAVPQNALLLCTVSGAMKKGVPLRNAPTLSSYHGIQLMSIIDRSKIGISPFYTIYPEVICGKSRLEKSLKAW